MRVSGGSAVKNMPANAGISGAVELPWMDPWVGKIPWRRKWQLTPVFLLGNPMNRGTCCAVSVGFAKSRSRVSERTGKPLHHLFQPPVG